MENNGNQLVRASELDRETQYIDVMRIIPENHPPIEVLDFYNDIQRIMEGPQIRS